MKKMILLVNKLFVWVSEHTCLFLSLVTITCLVTMLLFPALSDTVLGTILLVCAVPGICVLAFYGGVALTLGVPELWKQLVKWAKK